MLVNEYIRFVIETQNKLRPSDFELEQLKETKKILENYYTDLFKERFLTQNSHVSNAEEIYPHIMKKIVNGYFEIGDTQDHICNYIKNKLRQVQTLLKVPDESTYESVEYLIGLSLKGNKEARIKLFNHYSYMIDNQIEKLENLNNIDEIRKNGYIYLNEKINAYLLGTRSMHISSYLKMRINNYFKKYKKENEKSINLITEEIKEYTNEIVSVDCFESNDILPKSNRKSQNNIQNKNVNSK